jgi:hypothetical protein
MVVLTCDATRRIRDGSRSARARATKSSTLQRIGGAKVSVGREILATRRASAGLAALLRRPQKILVKRRRDENENVGRAICEPAARAKPCASRYVGTFDKK